MSGFAIVPGSLVPPAETCRRAAEVLSGVARTVSSLTAPTGRPESELAVELLLQSVGEAVRSRAVAADDEARDLTSARAQYSAAERVAAGG